MGLISELMKQGIRLLLINTQLEYVHFSDPIFCRDKHLRCTPVDETEAIMISCEESRDFLSGLGISGDRTTKIWGETKAGRRARAEDWQTGKGHAWWLEGTDGRAEPGEVSRAAEPCFSGRPGEATRASAETGHSLTHASKSSRGLLGLRARRDQEGSPPV